jgi:hypothetical protein
MPSQGLLDRPQDAKFYEWHLKDSTDSPYATFKFHYRSWESLQSLNLIPADHPRILLPPSGSVLSLVGLPREEKEKLQAEAMSVNEESPAKLSETSESSVVPWLTSVFDDSPESGKSRQKGELIAQPEVLENYSLRFHVPTSKFSSAVIDKRSSPNGSPVPLTLNRPLPQIPRRKSSLRHRRTLSSASTSAPSVTASLKSYYDRNRESPGPAEIGIAKVVHVDFPSPIKAKKEGEVDTAAISSLYVDEQVENSPLSEIATKRQGMTLHSSSGTFSFPNVTIRKLRFSGSKFSPASKTTPANKAFKENEHTGLLDDQTPLSLTESEWMCRTPSPKKNSQDDGFSASKLWSPGLSTNRKSPREGNEWSAPRRRESLLSQKVAGIPGEATDNPSRDKLEDEKIRIGNWI